MEQSVEQERAALERLEAEHADLPRRINNARNAVRRARFDAAHGRYDPWEVRGTENDLAVLKARAVALPSLTQKARDGLAPADRRAADT